MQGISERTVTWTEAGEAMEGRLVAPAASVDGARPVVLVVHTIRGRGEFEHARARALAELGYVGFAVDLYGAGRYSEDPAEGGRWMQALLDDRPRLQRRMAAALAAASAEPEVDARRVAAIGYCFGGLCVLDLARSTSGVAGVASFHGLLTPPPGARAQAIDARVLILHGWDDPLAPPEAVLAVATELTEAGADWQLHAYGHTAHSFTNPAAATPERGLVYQPRADQRSWRALENFLAELFGAP